MKHELPALSNERSFSCYDHGVARDPGDKQRRLLDAGVAEFAEFGIAGARMDRLAHRAGCSVGLVYTYFGSKVGLFDAIMDQVVATAVSTIPVDVTDLGEYAGRAVRRSARPS